MSTGLHAWIDESVDVHPLFNGSYILVATVSHPDDTQHLREHLLALTRPSWKRLHWREEDERDRARIVRALRQVSLTHVIVVAPAEAKRQERARRKCLQRLLFELDHLGITRASIESRQAAQDRRDQEMVEAMRGAHALSNGLRVVFAKPLDDPLLWIPDAVAGMTLAALRDGNHSWLDQLDGSYDLITL